MVEAKVERAGSEEYNVDLSLRRANAVREALESLGIASGYVSVADGGENYHAVPIADAVAEQANRRVIIIIQ